MAVGERGPGGPARYGSAPLRFGDDRTPLTPLTLKATELDAADLRIIDLLVADGRARARTMAVSVGLAEETVSDRVRALIERNIIGITAIFDWRVAGYNFDLFLFIRVGSLGAQVVIDQLSPRDEVISIYRVSGPFDIVAHVLSRDRASVLEFVSARMPLLEGVAVADVMLALDTVKYFHQFARVPTAGSPPALPNPIVALTALDHGIIGALMHNGRASYREVARDLGVADGTVRTRLGRLVSAGLLRIGAQVHPSNSGMIGAHALVGISAQGADGAVVAARLAAVDEILTVAATAGHFDLFCYVAAPTRQRLADLIATRIRIIDGVRSLETWEITAVPKHVGRWARW